MENADDFIYQNLKTKYIYYSFTTLDYLLTYSVLAAKASHLIMMVHSAIVVLIDVVAFSFLAVVIGAVGRAVSLGS